MNGDELGTRSRDDVLAAVYREGARRRRRRRSAWLAGAAAVVALALAVPLLVAGGSGEDASVVADRGADDPTTTTTRPTTTTTAAVVTTVAVDPATTAPPVTSRSTAAPPTTAAGPVCRNSTDPACGDFSWDPEPVDQPARITFDVSPPAPRAGDTVTVRVAVTDPDGPVSTVCGSYQWHDPYATGAQVGYPCTMVACPPGSEPHGPWTPPAPAPGAYEETFTHTFSTAGQFRFDFSTGDDLSCPPGNPYQRPASGSVPIVVAPAT